MAFYRKTFVIVDKFKVTVLIKTLVGVNNDIKINIKPNRHTIVYAVICSIELVFLGFTRGVFSAS